MGEREREQRKRESQLTPLGEREESTVLRFQTKVKRAVSIWQYAFFLTRGLAFSLTKRIARGKFSPFSDKLTATSGICHFFLVESFIAFIAAQIVSFKALTLTQ